MKKRFINWIGIISILVFIAGLFMLYYLDNNHPYWVAAGDDTLVVWVSYIIFVGVIVAFICAHAHAKGKAKFQLANSVEHRVHVRVASKSKDVSGTAFSTGSTHFVAFEFPDRSRKSFAMDAALCATFVEGETGILTYREFNDSLFYIDFHRHP